MQLQFPKKTLRYLNTVIQEVKNAEVTQELRIPEGMPDIGRVLTSWGQVMLRSKQWQADEISLSGGVKLWVLYVPEDGTPPRVAEGWLPFQLKWNVRNPGPEGPVRMMPVLRFADGRSISPRKLMLRAGIGVLAQGFSPAETEVYTPVEWPEDVQILEHTYPVYLAMEAGEKLIQIDEDLDMASQGVAGSKLISYSAWPEITEKRLLADKIAMKGNAKLHLVFRDEEGKIGSRNAEMPFSQLIDLEDSYSPDAQADVRAAVTDLEAEMDDHGQLRIKCGMVAQYLVDDRHFLKVADDAFSPRRKVEFGNGELNIPAVLEERNELTRAEQILNGQNGTVADVRFYPDYPRIRQDTQGIDMELPGVFQVLFYGENGELQSGSARWEGHLYVAMDENCQIQPMIQPPGPVQAVNSADGMSFNVPVQYRLRTTSNQGIPMMQTMELGQPEEPDPNRPSLILRRAGDDTLWKIAKESGSNVEAIRITNAIADEPDPKQMLLIPVW